VLLTESTSIKNRLHEALKEKLPGEGTHRLMLPVGRALYPEPGETMIIQSGVLMLIFPYRGKIHTCLIRRPSTMRNHGGQIAFPGGRYEPADTDLIQTALRESFEEIGTDKDQIEIIGALSPIYIQVSNFKIYPFIGWCDKLPDFKTDKSEVDELFKIPVETIFHPTTFQTKSVITARGTFEAPGFYIEPLFIWGATAMVLSEFKEVYRSAMER
jgi:8-oxo-dGTP pyrophosphatase MutT (NUDIX family)